MGQNNFKVLNSDSPDQSIFDYLMKNNGFYLKSIILRRDRKYTDFYANTGILNEQEDGKYVHEKFLEDIGDLISDKAKSLNATKILGVAETGETLARFGSEAFEEDAVYLDPYSEAVYSEYGEDETCLEGERVLIVYEVVDTGSSLRNAVETCERFGAEVVGVLTLVRRNLDIGGAEVGLRHNGQEFISLLDICFNIIVKEVTKEDIQKWQEYQTPVRLDVGYAATDEWHKQNIYKRLNFVGEPAIIGVS
jgi:Orotate phosphoribosyltransferase